MENSFDPPKRPLAITQEERRLQQEMMDTNLNHKPSDAEIVMRMIAGQRQELGKSRIKKIKLNSDGCSIGYANLN